MSESWKQWEGQVVAGKFHLRQYLGGSSHSAVFRTGLPEQEHQKAAIKLIPAQPDMAEVQLAQWKLAAKLSHPHLLPLFQMGSCQLSDEDLLYVVMEYAEENLSQILPERPLTPAEARDMLTPTLDALAFLHGHGFVHGHIKPSNILAAEDRLKISSDALWRMDEMRVRRATPSAYDPPEAVTGRLSPAADVWSLGVTLVEVMTQHLPEWDRAGDEDPVVPETLPAPFRDLASKCLIRDPHRRWSISDIAMRLRHASPEPQKRTVDKPQEVRAKPRQAPTKSQPALTKSRYLLPAVAAGVVLLALLAIPKFLHRPKAWPVAPSPASSAAPTSSKVSKPRPKPEPKPEERAAKPEASSSARNSSASSPTSNAEKQRAAGAISPSPAALRTETPSKKPSAGVARGEVLQQVLPDVSQKARDTIQGRVRVSVRVAVSSSGSVSEAALDSPGPSKYFADQALQAARRWEFVPAKVDGQYVPSAWLLRFTFTQSDTRVSPEQITP